MILYSNNIERFEVAPAREEDLADILRLAEEGGLSPWPEADYRAEIYREDSTFLVIREKNTGRGMAFIAARLITNGNVADSSQAEILNITVDRGNRKQGVGTTLLQAAIHALAAHSPATIWLEVRCTNTSSIAFYRNNGFTIEYVRKNFYSNPTEDAFVMKMVV